MRKGGAERRTGKKGREGTVWRGGWKGRERKEGRKKVVEGMVGSDLEPPLSNSGYANATSMTGCIDSAHR